MLPRPRTAPIRRPRTWHGRRTLAALAAVLLAGALSGCETDILSTRYGLPIAASDGPNAPTADEPCTEQQVHTGIVDKAGVVVACQPFGAEFRWTALPEQAATSPLLIFYGDSIAVETGSALSARLGPGWTVVLRTFGGTAPCDWSTWAARDIRAFRPAIVLTSFIGNAGTPCTMSGGEWPPSEVLAANYAAHLSIIARAGVTWGAQVILTSSPPPTNTDVAERTSAIARATWQAARVLAAEGKPVYASDDGGVLLDPSFPAAVRVGAQWLPCAADGSEASSCIGGSVQVHTPLPDGIHLCPTLQAAPTPDQCLVRNIGAERYGTAMAETVRAVVAHAPLPHRAPSTTEAPVVASDDFVAAAPVRLLDTRSTGATIDGEFRGGGVRAAGSVTRLPIAGRGGISADAVAVSLNIAAVGPHGTGFVSVVACDTGVPATSNVNFTGSAAIANAAMAAVEADGSVCIYTSTATHLVVDANGWFPVGTAFGSLVAGRLLDTRPNGSTVDGTANRIGMRTAGSVTEVQIAGRGGVPADAMAAALNITAVTPQGSGFVEVDACDAARPPNTSNLNFVAGRTLAGATITPLSPTGSVCVYTSATTHLLLDASGWFPAGSSYQPLTAARLLDTRPTGATTDGREVAAGLRPAGSVLELPVAGRGGVPSDARIVVLTVTVTTPRRDGFLTVHACDYAPPIASTVNFSNGVTTANLAMVSLGPDGSLCLVASADTHVVIDVVSWFRAVPPTT